MSPIFSRPSESFSHSGTALYSTAAALTSKVAPAIAVSVRMTFFLIRTVYTVRLKADTTYAVLVVPSRTVSRQPLLVRSVRLQPTVRKFTRRDPAENTRFREPLDAAGNRG